VLLFVAERARQFMLLGHQLGLMSDLWQVASEASERFAAQAHDYDRYRPRYPEVVFDDIVRLANLAPGAEVVEIGAGTGIATEPLVDRGLVVTAIEPAAALSAVAESKFGDRARLVVGRFEDFPPEPPVKLLVAFNAWHWVKPAIAVDMAAQLLEPGGSLALVWTEVVSWGQEPFEERLAETFGCPWPKQMDFVDRSMEPVRQDARFDEFRELHHPFERALDAATFVAVTKTYGGHRTAEQYQAIERIIDEDFGGTITKAEEAVLYLATRS
jgi:SAM-dependent methyltransferase